MINRSYYIEFAIGSQMWEILVEVEFSSFSCICIIFNAKTTDSQETQFQLYLNQFIVRGPQFIVRGPNEILKWILRQSKKKNNKEKSLFNVLNKLKFC